MSDVIVLAAEITNPLPIPAEAYGLIAAVIFGILLLLTMSFSNVAHRHDKSAVSHHEDQADKATDPAGSAH